jgi:hypothetical protein
VASDVAYRHQVTTSLLASSTRERSRPRLVGWLVLVSWVCLGIQVAETNYGGAGRAAQGLWLVIGSVLLLLVLRGSKVARGIVVVLSLTGAFIYLFGAFADGHAALLAAAFLGQALPLMLPPVRNHVQTHG